VEGLYAAAPILLCGLAFKSRQAVWADWALLSLPGLLNELGLLPAERVGGSGSEGPPQKVHLSDFFSPLLRSKAQ